MVDDMQHISVLQAVISPVVLISGVGMLVLSMTNRFSHTTDRARLLANEVRKVDGVEQEHIRIEIRILYHRLRILLLATSLALGSVLFTALLIISLFANFLFATTFRGLIVVLFALSLITLVFSLILFIRDMSLSLDALREDLHDSL